MPTETVDKPKTLIIAEKPSVARDLTSVLPGKFKKSKKGTYYEGDDYIVSFAVGHLLGLAEPGIYEKKYKRWNVSHLPIMPRKFKLTPAGERTKDQLAAIKKLLKSPDIDQVINACDAGREGELIFAYLYQYANCKKPVKRLWLSSLTKKAIEAAFENLRDGEEMENLEAAARSRAEADWVVGINATRAATISLRKGFDGVVSLGRVQTPTLAILVQRELEIQNFIPEDYWLVEAEFEAPNDRTYRGRYLGGKRLDTAAEAEKIERECKGQPGEITKLEQKEEVEKPPLLHDLTTLQREANSKLGFTAQRTLAAAQKLYEQHKALTYPRTSSRYLSEDMKDELVPIATHLGDHSDYKSGSDFVVGLAQLPTDKVINDAKVTDHHAIIPTNSAHNTEKMGEDEKKLFDLVARRFLAVFHPEARYKRTRIETEVGEHVFRSTGRVVIDAGWRGVYQGAPDEEKKNTEDDKGGPQALPEVEVGEIVQTNEIEILAKETQPPRRYSDASLLGAMETAGKLVDEEELREALKDSGIGTPATRSQIIERLINVGYAERVGRAMAATPKGIQVITLLKDHVLASPELTGQWERRLVKIEEGDSGREKFMKDIEVFSKKTVEELQKITPPELVRMNLGPCPKCGQDVIENRRAYSCWHSAEEPGCGLAIWKKVASKNLPIEVVRELLEKGETEEQVQGFRGRGGRPFKAKLKLERVGERWEARFNEEWAKTPREEDKEDSKEKKPVAKKKAAPKKESAPKKKSAA